MKFLRLNTLTMAIAATLFGVTAAIAQTPAGTPQIARNDGERRTPADTGGSSEMPAASNAPTFSAVTRVGVQTAATVPMTLNEAIRKALESNNDIEIARNDVRIAEQTLRSLVGTYDPVFTVAPNYDRSSTTGQRATNDFRANTSFAQQIKPGGGNVNTFFNNSRTENQFSQQQVTQGSGQTGGAIFSSSLGVTYTQPLWRNMKVDSTRRQIKIQRKRLSQSDADFRRQAITVISQVQSAYWDLVFALRNQQNQVANVNLSKENLRQIEARISAGSAAPLQRAEVETELANREGELLSATQAVATAENRLKQLFLRDPNSAEWMNSIVPTDTPTVSTDPVDMDAALKDAMEFRPELSRLKLEKEVNKIDLDFFKNQTRPRIDLVTTFSLNGLAFGQVNSNSSLSPLIVPAASSFSATAYLYNLICPGTVSQPTGCNPIPNVTIAGTPSYYNGGFGRSVGNLFRSDSPNLSVGVTFSFPLRNRTAKANLASSRIQSERIEAQTRSQEQTVIVEVRNAVQAVETSRLRVETARRARSNAEIQLDGERRRFDAGLSTTFLLFQRENALTNARNSEIRAETDYNKALAELQRATSTTFRVNNVDVESPVPDKK